MTCWEAHPAAYETDGTSTEMSFYQAIIQNKAAFTLSKSNSELEGRNRPSSQLQTLVCFKMPGFAKMVTVSDLEDSFLLCHLESFYW